MKKFIHRLTSRRIKPKESQPSGKLATTLFRAMCNRWRDAVHAAVGTNRSETECLKEGLKEWLSTDVPSAEWCMGLLTNPDGFEAFETLLNNSREQNYAGECVKQCSVRAKEVRSVLQELAEELIELDDLRKTRPSHQPRLHRRMREIDRPGYDKELH